MNKALTIEQIRACIAAREKEQDNKNQMIDSCRDEIKALTAEISAAKASNDYDRYTKVCEQKRKAELDLEFLEAQEIKAPELNTEEVCAALDAYIDKYNRKTTSLIDDYTKLRAELFNKLDTIATTRNQHLEDLLYLARIAGIRESDLMLHLKRINLREDIKFFQNVQLLSYANSSFFTSVLNENEYIPDRRALCANTATFYQFLRDRGYSIPQ